MARSQSVVLPLIRKQILDMPRKWKQASMVFFDIVGMFLCVWSAVWLSQGASGVDAATTALLTAAAAAVMLPILWLLDFYRSIIRYMGSELFLAGFKAAISAALVLGVFAKFTGVLATPLQWAISFAAISIIYIVGSRVTARVFLNRRNINRELVIVYGAGDGGAQLTAALKGGDDYLPIALVDDNILLQGKRVGGVEVYSPSTIEKLIGDNDVTRVLLAMPSASRRNRRAVLERLSDFPVHVQTIPEIGDLITGKSRVDDIRDVDVEDLLGRDAVPPDHQLLAASIEGKTVMVTGAGGSIGSELCRQIIQLMPKRLVLFEISEIALYNIEKELRGTAEKQAIPFEIVALLGSVHHQDRVREILQTYKINTVYHAAAYKHVPVVEHNLLEGVHNNIFGTLHAALAAIDSNVETFVLISTDKAVSPTSVMGASKRFAELILQALQDRHPATKFSMVRFGNVLASSGSVVPLFREQIRKGGPVTVTHRDIIRYFMTIPEAAQLVIQAGAMAKGGDVFVLDMGRPVKIQDLARRMINLMGLSVREEENPEGDIEIQYTGLRPAEKLFEELLIGTDVSGTRHPRIMRANEDYIEIEDLRSLLEELKIASLDLDRDRARQVLMRTVSGYQPQNGIEDLVWVARHGDQEVPADDKVIDITTRSA